MSFARHLWGSLGEGGRQFVRFGLVGIVGFFVDASVLTIEVATRMIDPVRGRFISFACAVIATFELNRRWGFHVANPRPYLTTFTSYLGVQGLGFICNLALYVLFYKILPPPFNYPLICLSIASAIVLAITFAGNRLFVFRSRAYGIEPQKPTAEHRIDQYDTPF